MRIGQLRLFVNICPTCDLVMISDRPAAEHVIQIGKKASEAEYVKHHTRKVAEVRFDEREFMDLEPDDRRGILAMAVSSNDEAKMGKLTREDSWRQIQRYLS